MLPKFEYYSPTSLSEALDLLEKYGEDAKIIAGGTDLLVSMRDRILKPKCLIDIKKIPELRRIEYKEGVGLTIGAAVTFKDILEYPNLEKKYRVLWEAIKTIGDMILRNRATLVGNICNASPAADSAPALLILDARARIINKNDGVREVPLERFFIGVKKTILKPTEIVKEVFVPEPPANCYGKYVKVMRVQSEDLAVVGVAGLAYRDRGDLIIRLAYSSVAPTPIRVKEVEEVFKKKNMSLDEKIEEAVKISSEKVSPISDVRGSAEYRLNLVKVATRRLIKELVEVV
ncbi:MAG: xanthine dehydrogenase family protein subunit M [Thaumarchaeota archaeon]|jgi:carbon-monoxide dehydrogenase medium subunit|nr:xanthine dehydrogenase family protein subunit M [Candidatus Geocrenenecus arthurdayi]MCL7390915.1 xanthine dehydrogenase family protein subunit M [Candidatus Geocrenenecus arthurdayi]MCL7397377.1 xanthine dehydrogenase family protein subunit M [Candidatus Geocrenenecus arthurdayi]